MRHIQSTSDVGETTFAGDGEMRALCRAMNWAATPLGPVEEWPEALRTVARTAQESPFPINLEQAPAFRAVLRGRNHVLDFVNEAYLQVIGRRDLAVGMGGTLTAESTPGEGSTFTLTLPRG